MALTVAFFLWVNAKKVGFSETAAMPPILTLPITLNQVKI